MNERIKELEKQCWQSSQSEPYALFDVKKFAELIVKECMTNLYLNGYDDAVIQIQKHFGVKE
jgi:hypothetical protein